MRVLVLTHPSGIPPEDGAKYSIQDRLAWKMEFDILTALKSQGHEFQILGVRDELAPIRNLITEWKPNITFNLLEEFLGVIFYEHHVVSFLELLRHPYTGCNPRGLLLSRDKSLCKQIFAYHRIPTPRFAVYRMGRKIHHDKRLKFPLIVKSLTEDASLGISQASIVSSQEKLKERVGFIHESLQTDALVEEYIEGRELYVALLGNTRIEAFPIWELVFSNMPSSVEHIATARVKWNSDYQRRHGIVDQAATNLSSEVITKIYKICKRVYRALYLSGYARIDLRLSPEGEVYVLEANPNPDISRDEAFAQSAETAGTSYDTLINKIANYGLNYRAEWKS